MVPYIVLTSDKRNWLLRGFMHQWHKYAPEIPVTIAGYTPPSFPLLDGFSFISIGEFKDYPAEKWSDALFELFLNKLPPIPFACLLLEDYWLVRRADLFALEVASTFMTTTKLDVFRFDITTDRLYSGKIRNAFTVDRLDIIEGLDPVYQVSFQASIWKIQGLLNVMQHGETPWQSEMLGTERWLERYSHMRCFGMRQWPLAYQIMVRNGEFIRAGEWMIPCRQLSNEDYAELEALGYTHE